MSVKFLEIGSLYKSDMKQSPYGVPGKFWMLSESTNGKSHYHDAVILPTDFILYIGTSKDNRELFMLKDKIVSYHIAFIENLFSYIDFIS